MIFNVLSPKYRGRFFHTEAERLVLIFDYFFGFIISGRAGGCRFEEKGIFVASWDPGRKVYEQGRLAWVRETTSGGAERIWQECASQVHAELQVEREQGWTCIFEGTHPKVRQLLFMKPID